MNLVVFSPPAFPQEQARCNNSVSPTMFGASSQLQATQAFPQNPLPGHRVITPAMVSNLLNPVSAGSASVNTSVMGTLVESTSQETLVESLRQCDPCSWMINESTGQGSLTQLPTTLPAAQTVESRFSAAEYDGPGSLAIASVGDPAGDIGSCSVLPVENVGVGLPNTRMIFGNLGEMVGNTGRYFEALHEQQQYSEAVSNFGDEAFSAVFDERQMSLILGLGNCPSLEEIRLMLSNGPPFRIGMNELTMPGGGTLFRPVSSSYEPSTNSESPANNDDTGYVLQAESLADSRMEPVPQVIEDRPSVCRSRALRAMLAERSKIRLKRIPDTQDRKRPKSANRKLNRATRKKNFQLNNPGRYIVGFLLEELSLPDDKRIIHWVNQELGIFKKDQCVNNELARRWGVRKKNKKMTYESLHRAIRCNYEKKHQAGNLKHLVYGIDGESPSNPASPLYQFNMSSVTVKEIINSYKKNNLVGQDK